MKAEIQKLHDDISNLPEAEAKLPVMMTAQGKWRVAVSQTWLLHMLQGWNSLEKLAGVPSIIIVLVQDKTKRERIDS